MTVFPFLRCGLRADSSEKQSPERRIPRCSPPSYSPVPPLVLLLREARQGDPIRSGSGDSDLKSTGRRTWVRPARIWSSVFPVVKMGWGGLQ